MEEKKNVNENYFYLGKQLHILSPVSYTHLDVYKRQLYYTLEMWLCFDEHGKILQRKNEDFHKISQWNKSLNPKSPDQYKEKGHIHIRR